MKLALVFATALAAFGQGLPVDLYLLEAGVRCGAPASVTGSEVAVAGVMDMGVAAPGDCVEMRMRLRNRSAGSITLTQLYASSPAAVFSVENHPSLPYFMAPGMNVDFRLRFSPSDPGSYTGVLYFLDKLINLSAAAPEGVQVDAQRGAGWQTLRTTDTVDFGVVERKQSSVRQFALINRTAAPLQVRSVVVSGAGYSVEGLTLPVQLGAGQTRAFAVRFAPLKSGILRGTIRIDGRTFGLEGFATEPPFPILSWEAPPARSGQQITVKLRMSEPSKAVGSVKITLAGLEADPSVTLLPDGGRTATLALREGATELSQMLQTGTTQGTLRLKAELDRQIVEAEIPLAPLAPEIKTVSAERRAGRIELRITGFDNTRSMQDAGFQFYDRGGAAIGGVIRTSTAKDFEEYFAKPTPGGTFALGASFPVTGDINQVAGVEVELRNTTGTGKANRLQF